MCGRYSLTTPVESLRQLFAFAESPNLRPRANIAPTQDVAAVRLEAQEGEAPRRHFAWLVWGLIPSWARERAIGQRMINARAETLAEKPAFRAAFSRRRCLVLADGFFEWKTENKVKQPYRITLADGSPFAFAGLYEVWRDPESGERVESATIVTTEACAALKAIHHRMPVMLTPEECAAWLDPEAARPALEALLRPFEGALRTYPVSRAINSPRNDDPALLAPLEEAGQGAAPRLL